MIRPSLFRVLLLTLAYALTAATAASAPSSRVFLQIFLRECVSGHGLHGGPFSEDIPHIHGHLVMGSVPPRQRFRSGSGNREENALRFSLRSAGHCRHARLKPISSTQRSGYRGQD